MLVNGQLMHCRQFRLPKRGEAAEEYEDASASDPDRGRFAIADGAAESADAALWAKLLVEEYVRAPIDRPGRWGAWLAAVQQRWVKEIAHRPGLEAPAWFVENRREQGAFATFLGLVLDEPAGWSGTKGKRWQALAVGDSCFFQMRNGRLIQAFPITQSRDFGNSPSLIGSRQVPGQLPKVIVEQGDWCPSDRFWLMTDALALWFLRQIEEKRKPWEVLEAVLATPEPNRSFIEWIDGMRSRQQLRNDDVTLVAIWF